MCLVQLSSARFQRIYTRVWIHTLVSVLLAYTSGIQYIHKNVRFARIPPIRKENIFFAVLDYILLRFPVYTWRSRKENDNI